ncbi:MAG: pilus assembly protein [Phycisphaerae bacterium]|nr:pilus assembly protein [Phycisphaerae bacterium]
MKSRYRRGAATVEMAVVTPLLLTMVFGVIEFGWLMSVRQSLIQAAREGARTAALPGSTEEQVIDQVDRYLGPMNMAGYQITFEHPTPPDNPTETVTIDYTQNSLIGGFFGQDSYHLTATCAMRKEGYD